jgi:hypothetical protein
MPIMVPRASSMKKPSHMMIVYVVVVADAGELRQQK